MRKSAFLKVAVIFVITYTISVSLFFVWDTFKAYDRMAEKNLFTASNYTKMGRILLKNSNLDDLSARLDEALRGHEIDYYQVRQNGEELVYASSAGPNDPVPISQSEVEGVHEINGHQHFLIKENSYILIVGFKFSLFAVMKSFLITIVPALIRELMIVTLFTTAIVLYSFRDLRELVRRIRQRGENRMEAMVAHSNETQTLVQGIRGLHQNTKTLREENTILRNHVLSSLQNELFSGRQPPYEFDCTLVRTDINNFTTLFSSLDHTELMSVVNEFFIGVAKIVARYQGFVYEFIGDEVLYYFKSDDHQNSSTIALSAARDINDLADLFNAQTEQKFAQPFRIKTSLSWGRLRFGPLVHGHSLAGLPLIETVRILSHVHEKSENTILFDDRVHDQLGDICSSRELGVVMLKGIAKSRRLHVYQSQVPVIHFLKQGDQKSLERLTNYRSNRDISETLNFVTANIETLSETSIQRLFAIFRKFHVTENAPEIKQSYLNLMELLIQWCKTDSEKSDPSTTDSTAKIKMGALASVISCAPNFFCTESFTERVSQTITQCMNFDDRRVLANIVDAFSALQPDTSNEMFNNLLTAKDNRIAANVLILSAKRNWDKTTRRKLAQMLKVQSAYYKASGLYALGEIARYLKKTDAVAFSADLEIHELIQESLQLATHPNQMVRRQALSAAVKAERTDILRNIVSSQQPVLIEVRNEIVLFLAAVDEAKGGNSTDTSSENSEGNRLTS